MKIPKKVAFVYACVSKGEDIQAQGGQRSHLKNTLTPFLHAIVHEPLSDKIKGSLGHGPYNYNFLRDRGMIFVVISRTEVDLRIVFNFLKDLQDIFNSGSDKQQYQEDIHKLLLQYMDPFQTDKIRRISSDLEEVKDVMRQNLNNLVDRGIQLEMLDETVVELEQNTLRFKQRSETIHKVVWWKDFRFRMILGSLLFIVLFVVVVVACGGFSFTHCKAP